MLLIQGVQGLQISNLVGMVKEGVRNQESGIRKKRRGGPSLPDQLAVGSWQLTEQTGTRIKPEASLLPSS